MKNPLDKILNLYFTKNSLPYWSILLIDCAFIVSSGMVTYWMFHSAVELFENTLRVLNTLFCFVLLSIPGFRLFHTYAGFMRYASFVDLMRVVYGNIVSLALVLIADYGFQYLPGDLFVHFNTTSIFLIYLIATTLMWGLRVFVKTLYDVAFSNSPPIGAIINVAMQCDVR